MVEVLKSDPLRALLDLDPRHLLREDRHTLDPAVMYAREPWAGSTTRPFPSTRNTPAMAALAFDLAEGRKRGGVVVQVERLARRLHQAQVPRDLAQRELVTFHRELTKMLAVIAEHEDGARAG